MTALLHEKKSQKLFLKLFKFSGRNLIIIYLFVSGENIIKAAFFHNGRKITLQSEKKSEVPCTEKFQHQRFSPTVKNFGYIWCFALNLWFNATALILRPQMAEKKYRKKLIHLLFFQRSGSGGCCGHHSHGHAGLHPPALGWSPAAGVWGIPGLHTGVHHHRGHLLWKEWVQLVLTRVSVVIISIGATTFGDSCFLETTLTPVSFSLVIYGRGYGVCPPTILPPMLRPPNTPSFCRLIIEKSIWWSAVLVL